MRGMIEWEYLTFVSPLWQLGFSAIRWWKMQLHACQCRMELIWQWLEYEKLWFVCWKFQLKLQSHWFSFIPDSLGKCKLSIFVVHWFLFHPKQLDRLTIMRQGGILQCPFFVASCLTKLFNVRQTVFLKKSIRKGRKCSNAARWRSQVQVRVPSAFSPWYESEQALIVCGINFRSRLELMGLMKIQLPMRAFLFSYKDTNIPHFTWKANVSLSFCFISFKINSSSINRLLNFCSAGQTTSDITLDSSLVAALDQIYN